MDKEILNEFRRLYHEANDVVSNHDEFLKLIYISAVKLHTGEWRTGEICDGDAAPSLHQLPYPDQST